MKEGITGIAALVAASHEWYVRWADMPSAEVKLDDGNKALGGIVYGGDVQ